MRNNCSTKDWMALFPSMGANVRKIAWSHAAMVSHSKEVVDLNTPAAESGSSLARKIVTFLYPGTRQWRGLPRSGNGG